MNEITTFLTHFEQYKLLVYVLIFFVSFLESFAFVGEIVPGAVFAVSSGFLASEGFINIYLSIAIGSSGIILADFVSYYIATFFYDRLKDKPILKRHENLLLKGEEFFGKHGGKSILIGVFIGALRPIIPFVAGAMKMNKSKFTFWVFISGFLWGVYYFGIGYFFGKNWNIVESIFKNVNMALLAFIIVGAGVYLIGRKKIRKKK